ncbi:MAG: alkaline shock response membrane anchor protein AmaP [Clostridia bacterium]
MKQKITGFDRFLLIFMMLVVILTGLALICIAMNIVTMETLVRIVSMAYGSLLSALITGAIGIVLLIVALRIIIAFNRRACEQKPASVLVNAGELGSTYISLCAIDGMIQKHCRANSKVKECASMVVPREDGIAIQLKLVLLTDVSVPELTHELHESLKIYIESLSGISVKDIGILVLNTPLTAKAQP